MIDRIGRIRIDHSPVEMFLVGGGIGRAGRIGVGSNWIPPPA